MARSRRSERLDRSDSRFADSGSKVESPPRVERNGLFTSLTVHQNEAALWRMIDRQVIATCFRATSGFALVPALAVIVLSFVSRSDTYVLLFAMLTRRTSRLGMQLVIGVFVSALAAG